MGSAWAKGHLAAAARRGADAAPTAQPAPSRSEAMGASRSHEPLRRVPTGKPMPGENSRSPLLLAAAKLLEEELGYGVLGA